MKKLVFVLLLSGSSTWALPPDIPSGMTQQQFKAFGDYYLSEYGTNIGNKVSELQNIIGDLNGVGEQIRHLAETGEGGSEAMEELLDQYELWDNTRKTKALELKYVINERASFIRTLDDYTMGRWGKRLWVIIPLPGMLDFAISAFNATDSIVVEGWTWTVADLGFDLLSDPVQLAILGVGSAAVTGATAAAHAIQELERIYEESEQMKADWREQLKFIDWRTRRIWKKDGIATARLELQDAIRDLGETAAGSTGDPLEVSQQKKELVSELNFIDHFLSEAQQHDEYYDRVKDNGTNKTDINNDSITNQDDMDLLIDNFNYSGEPGFEAYSKGDLDNNGVVDFADFLIMNDDL